MKSRRSTVLTIIMAALVLALGLTASARAQDTWGKQDRMVTTKMTVPLDITVLNPVTNEDVHFVGDVNAVTHTRFFPDGSVLVSILCNERVKGVGAKTGDQYILEIHDLHRFTIGATGLPFTVLIGCNTRLLNAGSCNDVDVPLTLEITVAQDGKVSLEYVEGPPDIIHHDE